MASTRGGKKLQRTNAATPKVVILMGGHPNKTNIHLSCLFSAVYLIIIPTFQRARSPFQKVHDGLKSPQLQQNILNSRPNILRSKPTIPYRISPKRQLLWNLLQKN